MIDDCTALSEPLQATALHLAVVADHPDMIAYLLDLNALLTDNSNGQNALDVAIALDLETCASVFVSHERYCVLVV